MHPKWRLSQINSPTGERLYGSGMHTPMSSLPKIDYAAHPAYGALEPDAELGRQALQITLGARW